MLFVSTPRRSGARDGSERAAGARVPVGAELVLPAKPRSSVRGRYRSAFLQRAGKEEPSAPAGQ